MTRFFSRSTVSSRFTHVVTCIRISLLLQTEKYSIVRPHHILCIQSPVSGHLVVSTFWLLWIVLRTLVYKCLFLLSILLGNYLGTELLDHMAIFLTTWGTSQLFPTIAASFYIPTSNAQGSNFSLSLPILLIFTCFLENSHSSGYEVEGDVICDCSFHLYFPKTGDIEYLFLSS